MAQKTIQGTADIARKIKARRNELGLTIEEAALRAGVGTKTWSRYEAGASIRTDKCKGVCKALNWRDMPTDEPEETTRSLIEESQESEAWSPYLADHYGPWAAVSFAVGSDMLLDDIRQDMEDLASMPIGSHIGQLSTSFLNDELPAQFLMRYDYDFLYRMKYTLIQLREKAKRGLPMKAHTVMEELLIHLCCKEAIAYIELTEGAAEFESREPVNYPEDWAFDLFEDMDIITFLYSGWVLDDDHPYAFLNWYRQQFFVENEN